MRQATVKRLLQINREFYENLAGAFAASRRRPQAGYDRLLASLPSPCPQLLDVGCGHGRFGAYLLERRAIDEYAGVDASSALLKLARSEVPGTFYERDLSLAGCLAGVGRYPAIACLATLQHIPGRSNRIRLLREMADHLLEEGRILLSNWQFRENERQIRKIRAWQEVGLRPDDLEAADFLLSWQREQFGLRYVSAIDEDETNRLAQATGLAICDQYRSDGREGNLNLYTVLTT